MRKLEKYFTDAPITDDVAKLSDPKLSFERHRTQVNELVLNAIIKYLAEYLNVVYSDVLTMRQGIKDALEKKKKHTRGNVPYNGKLQETSYFKGEDSDHYPVWCHADIRKTAAIFKEIAFNDRFIADGTFRGLDLGSGTGILTLAMAIAAKRKQIRYLSCTGVEFVDLAADNSRRLLREILGEKSVKILNEDLLEPQFLESLLSKGVNYWVSETIASHTKGSTPKMDLSKSDFGLSTTYAEENLRRTQQNKSDPFVEILRITMNTIPDFLQKVGRGEIAMFPDINPYREPGEDGLFRPDKNATKLMLLTGKGRPILGLHEIGVEFEQYEDLGLGALRWDSDNKPKQKVRFIEKATQPKRKPATPKVNPKQLKLFEE